MTEHERAQLLDVLRSLALFGILMVNFAGGVGTIAPALDAFILGRFIDPFIRDSARPLFAFLFGLGSWLSLQRAHRHGASAIRVQVRKLMALFLLGTAHYLLIWDGDILTAYAVMGLLMLPLCHASARVVGITALALVCLSAEYHAVAEARALERESTTQGETRWEVSIDHEITGTPVVGSAAPRPEWQPPPAPQPFNRLEMYQRFIGSLANPSWILQGDIALAFLIGVLAGQQGWLTRVRQHSAGLHRLLLAGFIIAVLAAGQGLFVPQADGPRMRYLSYLLENGMLAVVYVAGTALLMLQQGVAASGLAKLQPAGQMALTNYLAQSVVMTWIVFPLGQVLPGHGAALMLVIHILFFFLAQVPASRWWLTHYRFGPIEWLWRSITYQTAIGIRRTQGSAPAGAPSARAACRPAPRGRPGRRGP